MVTLLGITDGVQNQLPEVFLMLHVDSTKEISRLELNRVQVQYLAISPDIFQFCFRLYQKVLIFHDFDTHFC